MTGEALDKGAISQEIIKEKLLEAKGDIFIAANLLNCTTRELDIYIRSDEHLQVYAMSLQKIRIDPEYRKWSQQQFREKLDDLMTPYRLDALESIHKLATMPTETAAAAEVKRKAAIHLLGKPDDYMDSHQKESIWTELNQEYVNSSRRIKEVRATLHVTYEEEGPSETTGEPVKGRRIE